MLGDGAQQTESKMDEEKQNDAPENDVEEVDPPEIAEWEQKHDFLCQKIFKLSEIQATMEYSKQAENNESVCQEMSSLKHSNPLLLRYLTRQMQEAEISIDEAINDALKCIEKSLSRIFYFIDYMFLTNYRVLSTCLTDDISQKEPDTAIKIEEPNKKQGPFSLKRQTFQLTGYPEEGLVTIEFTNDRRFRITTRLTKMYPSPRVTYVLKAQIGNEESRDVVRTCPARLKLADVSLDVVNYTRSFPVLEKSDLEKPFTFEIHVEPPCVRDTTLGRNGFLVWTVDKYAERKLNEKMGLIKYHLGPYFYTRTGQYRIQIKMYLNGHCKWRDGNQNDGTRKDDNQSQNDESGKESDQNQNDEKGNDKKQDRDRECGLTAGIVFLISEFDSVPRFEFAPLKVAINVFNPDDLPQSIERSLIAENFDKLYIDIGSDKEVEKLITNDILYYKVTVADVPKTNDH